MNRIAAATLFLLLSQLTVAQTVTTINNFVDVNGAAPTHEILTQGRDGKLYGTTYGGGNGRGLVFSLSVAGGVTPLYEFIGGTDGGFPIGGLTLASNNKFYGSTTSYGSSGLGVLYSIDTAGHFTVVHSFTGGADSGDPVGPPIEATDGSLYGVTQGSYNVPNLYPSVYKLTQAGVFSTIYTFPTVSAQPYDSPVQARDGRLYVAAYGGGSQGCGSVTKLTTAGVVLAILNFSCKIGGSNPVGRQIVASDGNLYGTTKNGGTYGAGTIYKIDATTGKFSSLYSFGITPTDGQNPEGRLTQGSDGALYGSTSNAGAYLAGTLFQFTLAGEYSQLYSFENSFEHSVQSGLMQDTSGIFFSTTDGGGPDGLGTIYSLNMGLGPFVTFVVPTRKVGNTAQIVGQGLTGTTSVTFNGVPASSFTVVADTYMTAVVPSGATTGPVVVTTPSGPLTSNVNFRVSK